MWCGSLVSCSPGGGGFFLPRRGARPPLRPPATRCTRGNVHKRVYVCVRDVAVYVRGCVCMTCVSGVFRVGPRGLSMCVHRQSCLGAHCKYWTALGTGPDFSTPCLAHICCQRHKTHSFPRDLQLPTPGPAWLERGCPLLLSLLCVALSVWTAPKREQRSPDELRTLTGGREASSCSCSGTLPLIGVWGAATSCGPSSQGAGEVGAD